MDAKSLGKHKIFVRLFLIAFPLGAVALSLFMGRYPIPSNQVIKAILLHLSGYEGQKTVVDSVIWDIRLPRAVLGFLVGGALAVSGATLQGIFRNPLVDSGVLGVGNGASFGAVLAFVFFDGHYLWVLTFAFTFGLLAVLMSYAIANFYTSVPTIMLVLGGIIVSSLFSSLVSLGKYMADPYDELPAIVFWLMGSLAKANAMDVRIIIIPVILGTVIIFLYRWKINVLSLGDREALTLGVNVRLTKGILIACATLITAATVSVSGTIGWIGLVIPHIIRMGLGNDNRRIIPAAFLFGGGFLAMIDILARTLTTSEIPIGILTSLIGAPFYIVLLRRTKGRVW